MIVPGFVPGLIGWGVGKTLDQVIQYVAEASKSFDHCQELQTLLSDIKPSVERALQHLNGTSSSTSGGAVAWLRELKPQLETAEDQLQKALNWLAERKEGCAVPFDIITRQKWSRSILKITEGIRKVAHDRAPFVNLETTLHISKALEDLTIVFHRKSNVDRISQLMEEQMEVAELRLTKLVHTELCKIGGEEAIVNQVKGVLEAGIHSEIQNIKRWQEKANQNPQEQSDFREESILTHHEPEVDGSTNFTTRFQRIRLSGLTNDHEQAASQEEPGSTNDHQAASQDDQVAGSTNLTNCLESTSESSATEDWSTPQASVKEIITVHYKPSLVKYSLHDLKEATDDFAVTNVVGRGGFGTVFRGRLENGVMIAVKRFDGSNFNFRMFDRTEILNELEILDLCGHQNIARLYGYCNLEKPNIVPKKPSIVLEKPNGVKKLRHMFKTRKEGRLLGAEERVQVLVFEYMENGLLNNWLHRDKGISILVWPIRFNIVLGIARGLVYLHHDAPRCFLHCDIKTSNILLDAHFRPRIGAFGSSRIFNDGDSNSSHSAGRTMGYIDPFETPNTSLTSDVYSFGVVLLEIVSGRRPYQAEGKKDTFLSNQATRLFETGGAEEVVKQLLDPKLMNETLPASQVRRVVHVALLCVLCNPTIRPNMREVLSMLLGEMDLKPICRCPPCPCVYTM